MLDAKALVLRHGMEGNCLTHRMVAGSLKRLLPFRIWSKKRHLTKSRRKA
jgi:hypothetical protein